MKKNQSISYFNEAYRQTTDTNREPRNSISKSPTQTHAGKKNPFNLIRFDKAANKTVRNNPKKKKKKKSS